MLRTGIRSSISLAIGMGIASLLFIKGASALVIPTNTEFEDWGTGFSPTNPLTCNGTGSCSTPDTASGISPTNAGFQVNRTATLNQIKAGQDANLETAQVVARTLSAGPPCPMQGEGCLQFKQGNNSVGSLALKYAFVSPGTSNALPVQFENDKFGILAQSLSDPFYIAGFYLDGAGHWQFADAYFVDSSNAKFYAFDLPTGTTTSEIEFVYNPLSDQACSNPSISTCLVPANIPPDELTQGMLCNGADFTCTLSSIEAELCCARSDPPVPEPPTLPLMGGALAAFALVRRSKFRWSSV